MPAHASRTLAPAPSAPPSGAERRLLAPARPRHRPADAGTPAELSASPATRPVKLRSVDSGEGRLVVGEAEMLAAGARLAHLASELDQLLDDLRRLNRAVLVAAQRLLAHL